MSLNQVYPEPDSEASKTAKVDIILVQDSNPKSKGDEVHALDTWTESRLWPRANLPKKLPDARISLYTYDSSAFSKASFSDKANELLETIRCDREDWEGRPLILIGHSRLGEILIKQALINARQDETYKQVFAVTKGLAFFRTPDNDQDLMITDGLFRHQLSRYLIVYFWVDKDTVVSKDSSRFRPGNDRERNIELKANHRGVTTFDQTTMDENSLEEITTNVKWLYDNALQI